MKKINQKGNQKRRKNTREQMKKLSRQAYKQKQGNTRQYHGTSSKPEKIK